MSLVIDSSVSLAFCFEDERSPAILAMIDRVVAGGGLCPPLWPYEVANGLLVAERRGRIDTARRVLLLAGLADLGLTIDSAQEGDPFAAVSRLAASLELTVYDAAYLELAQRRRLPLATLDKALLRAAHATGVEVLTDR